MGILVDNEMKPAAQHAAAAKKNDRMYIGKGRKQYWNHYNILLFNSTV